MARLRLITSAVCPSITLCPDQSILPINPMTDYLPSNHPHNAHTASDVIANVADDLNRDRHSRGIRRIFTEGKIERGEAYMNGTRTLLRHCRPLMQVHAQKNVRTTYDEVRDAKAKLDTIDASRIWKYPKARKFKRLSKEAYQTVKRASNQAVDDHVVGPLDETHPSADARPASPEQSDGTDPPAGAPATPEEPDGLRPAGVPPAAEEPDGTDPTAGASPGTPEEPDAPLPYDPFTDSHAAATNSIEDSESTEDVETTTTSGAAGIGVPEDDASESYSFFYNPDLAASGTSIASYKTERTVNSRKSRYNVRPRHKYADHGYLRPQGPASSGVEDASDSKTELRDEHVDDSDESPSSPHSVRPGSPGPSPEIQPLDGPSTAPPDTEHVHGDMPSQPPSPYQGVGFLSANPAALTGRSHEIGSLCSVDVFGSDSEAGAD